MKVSLNWVKKYTATDLSVAELVEKIGAQLGAVDEVINIGERYQGIVVAKVIGAEKHPNADKLSVCLVDDGRAIKTVKRNDMGLVEVVCGAPNVAAGQLVVWIPPGATVPNTYDKDPFVLEAKELRGVVSNGMIASARELGLGDEHNGILVLEGGHKPGTPLLKVLELDDTVVDIENKMFTHRPDCFGILGVAREIAGIQGRSFKSPTWYKEEPKLAVSSTLRLDVSNDTPEVVPRFCALAMTNVKVGPSPAWLVSYLARVGIKPINNIVDITNYVMMETGQPLHAYDYDKVKTGKLGVRLSKTGESLKLLGGKTVKLQAGAVVITDGTKPIGLGGVMGGAGTEVDAATTGIILEAATFDMNLTRKTAMTYGLFTDAATRFSKGQSPRQNLAALARAANFVKDIAGGKPGQLRDVSDRQIKPKVVEIETGQVNKLLGEKLTALQMKKLLANVEFSVATAGHKLRVVPPFWRTDISIAEDVVEEIGRLYGYEHLPQQLPSKDLSPADANPVVAFKGQLRQILTRAGANEVLTYSFVHGRLLESANQDSKKAYRLRNATSPDLQYYRLTLAPSLLEKVHPNRKAGFDNFALYEIGKTHIKGMFDEEKVPAETDMLAAVITTTAKNPSYYWARNLADYVLDELHIFGREYEPFAPAKEVGVMDYYEPARSAIVRVDGHAIGIIGEPSAQIRQSLKLTAGTAMFEFEIEKLYEYVQPTSYYPLNKYPELNQDICLKVAADLSYEEVDAFVWDQLEQLTASGGYVYTMSTLDIFQRPDDKQHKQITWRIELSHPERTLTTSEVNRILDEIAAEAKAELKAERI